MSSNLKVNAILPSTGTNVAIGTAGGSITMVGNVDIDINSGISTFNDIHISDKIVHDGDTNTSLRFPAADTFSVETAGSERFRITSDGNIGINVTPTNYSNYVTLALNDTTGSTIEGRVGGTLTGSFSVDSLVTINAVTSIPMVFKTANTERLRITSDGLLQLNNDSAKIQLGASQDLSIYHDGSSNRIIAANADLILQSNNYNIRSENGSSTYLNIDSSGYVGVKRSTPLANLHTTNNELAIGANPTGAAAPNATYDGLVVDGEDASILNIRSSADGNISYGRVAFSDDVRSRGYIDYRHRDGAGGALEYMNFAVAGSERLRITSSGELWIGTTSGVSNSGYGGFSLNGSNGSLLSMMHNGTEKLRLFGHTNPSIQYAGNLTFYSGVSGGTERARITSDGKFLMGNTGSIDMGFGPQVLTIRGGNTAGYNGTAAAIFGQTDNAASTMIVYASGSAYATNMIDVRCARSGHTAYKFAIFRSNSNGDTEFTFYGHGNAFADGAWYGGGADYAEYFEWSDGNSSDEDRRGYTVVLENNKIRKSTTSDAAETIIGVISANPSVVGDGDEQWKQKYQKDDFGAYILDSDGHKILNPDWDETKTYVRRENRKEWSIVGLMGKIRIRKGQTMGTRWIKMRDISDSVEEWLVR